MAPQSQKWQWRWVQDSCRQRKRCAFPVFGATGKGSVLCTKCSRGIVSVVGKRTRKGFAYVAIPPTSYHLTRDYNLTKPYESGREVSRQRTGKLSKPDTIRLWSSSYMTRDSPRPVRLTLADLCAISALGKEPESRLQQTTTFWNLSFRCQLVDDCGQKLR